ncbi:MAG: S8 family serine peptidase, partial [Planctomycetota bacterium]
MPQRSLTLLGCTALVTQLCLLDVPVLAQEMGRLPDPAAQLPVPDLFEPVRGVRELSGVLCARPVQPSAALRAGKLAQLREIALDRLAAFEWKRYEPATDEYLIHVPAGSTEAEVAAALLRTGAFQYVEPDWLVYPVEAEVTGSSDPLAPLQWHHDPSRLDSDGAWAVETGRSSVVIAICDTGLRIGHEDFSSLRREGFHVPSRTWQLDGGPVDDINDHGTWCAGVAVADGTNGVGTAGIGWGLGYRPMRVTDEFDGGAFISDLTLAARTAADAGDRIASVSYTGVTTFTVPITGEYLRNQGSLLVWAAGNNALTFSGDRNDGMLVVGATSPSDQLTEFSNRGSLIDLVAPGTGILAPGRAADDAYDYVAGTSFSCPIVAGVCGLVWSRNPNLTPDEVQSIVLGACDDLGEPGVDDLHGHGRVDAARALERTPSHLLRFFYVNGRAREIDPAGGTTLNVVALPGAQQIPDVTAARFWVDSGAGFVSTPAEYLGVNTFRGTFPAVPCGSTVRYYFEFPLESPSQGAGPANNGILRSPERGSEGPFEAVATSV